MTWIRRGSLSLLLSLFALSLGANWIVPPPAGEQSRAEPDSPPAKSLPLGTDNLGRDRFSRLLYGMRFSLLLAPVAAALAMVTALLVGGSAALAGGWWDRIAMSATDLFLSLPWLFLFLTVRAKLPLNTEPLTSLLITFALMGLLGWAAGARVVRASVLSLRHSPFALYARAFGCPPARIWLRHLLPHLGTVLLAQFWIAIPGFILGEASLGLLGMGAPPPLPTWGNLLRELESVPGWSQYWVFAPVLLLSLVMVLFQLSRPAPGGVRSA